MGTDAFPWGFVSGGAKGMLYVKFRTAPWARLYWGSLVKLPVEEASTGQLPSDQDAVYARVLSPSNSDLPSSAKVPKLLKTREARSFFAISILKAKFPHCF